MAASSSGTPAEMRDVFGQTLVELGKDHSRMLVLDADLHTSSKAGYFKAAFPDQALVEIVPAVPAHIKVNLEYSMIARRPGGPFVLRKRDRLAGQQIRFQIFISHQLTPAALPVSRWIVSSMPSAVLM